MSKQPDPRPTVSNHEIHPSPNASPSPSTPPTKTPKQRPGASILSSSDPSTEALRRWALDKQTQYPGQDGSFAQGGGTAGVVDGMAWGGPWLLPHKGDTLPPPDERVGHGEARVLGGEEGGTKGEGEGEGGEGVKKRRSFLELLRGGKKGEGKGEGGEK